MKKALNLCIAMLFLSFIMIACEDKEKDENPLPSAGQKEMLEVVKGLEKISEVSGFTNALKKLTPELDFEETQLTVLAIKDPTVKATESGYYGYTAEALKRHIVKGNQDFGQLGSDTLILKSISDDVLYATKVNGQIQINGIPLASNAPEKAGNSYIYVVSKTVPEVKDIPDTKYKMTFTIHECNEKWSSENNKESSVSENSTITFYKKNGEIYAAIDSIRTDDKGIGIYRHNYAEGLYYTVRKDLKGPIFNGYLVRGIFTSQSQIDSYAQYRTNTSLDLVKPGTLKLSDINGDGIINKEDMLSTKYFFAENNETDDIFIVSNNLILPEGFITIENLPLIKESLDETFTSFVSFNYTTNKRLSAPEENNLRYPDLYNLRSSEFMYDRGYRYINNFLKVATIIEEPGYPEHIKKEWNKMAARLWAQYAYVYTVMTSYYGDLVIVTRPLTVDEVLNVTRNPKAEVLHYIESLIDKVSRPEADVVRALVARLYTNEHEYAKARQLALDVVNRGNYYLPDNSNSSDHETNAEVMLGGYVITDIPDQKGKYTHPVRFTEVMLTLAECELELGKIADATLSINEILAAKGKPLYYDGITAQTLRDAIRKLWKDEMNKEGFDYMLLNRWDILITTLGQFGALDYNKLLPIPQREIDNNPNIKQNPGY
ncbi:RagB/SusD family nutrient uptake outer membrane protein [uncultured Dysgonomonas sp.]|uniref:RagB/SusD domain-containing protein n=1 Tax=uncultured Dysgonomonas sp. TaxID=206096 RepID=A0A212IZE6_9BACT|nr:RagB/SusD family nutrient uptake outer membrane protein [uncultured Dysgonomonas sp.]SBV92572.1 conserved exported hypothetical protein [uncultured Dysgonomonas sp.]